MLNRTNLSLVGQSGSLTLTLIRLKNCLKEHVKMPRAQITDVKAIASSGVTEVNLLKEPGAFLFFLQDVTQPSSVSKLNATGVNVNGWWVNRVELGLPWTGQQQQVQQMLSV